MPIHRPTLVEPIVKVGTVSPTVSCHRQGDRPGKADSPETAESRSPTIAQADRQHGGARVEQEILGSPKFVGGSFGDDIV